MCFRGNNLGERLLPMESSSRRENVAGFTLMELLVIIGIIAILLVAVVPAVTSLSKSGNRKGAISNVMNALEQARSLAITSGRATYVVFADHTVPEAYRCKGFVVFHENESFTPQAASKWYFLPTGVSFRPKSGVLTAQTASPKIAFTCPGSIGPTPLELPFIKFDTNGMATASGGLWIDLFAGFVDADGEQRFTDKQQQTSGKYDAVVIAPFTGRVRYVDPYS